MAVSSFKSCSYLWWVCFLVIFFISTPSCQGLGRYCGRALPDALDLICTNGFAMKITKKSIEPEDQYADIEPESDSPFEMPTFFSSPPNNMLAKIRRRRHGIVDECCKKPCTVSEVRSYCL